MDVSWGELQIFHSGYRIAALKKRKRLTRRRLRLQDDWNDWLQSEFKQLNQYRDQHMFNKPKKLPRGANLPHLLWTYIIKDDKRKKKFDTSAMDSHI